MSRSAYARPRLRPWQRALRRVLPSLALATVAVAPAQANNYGESLAWQFRTASDLAAQMSLLDLLEKHRGGYYAAPVYNTTVERQFNCPVGATAIGNTDTQAAQANSPTTTGAVADATGNGDEVSTSHGTTTSTQDNEGAVGAGVTGSTSTSVDGTSWQALNSSQANSGNQAASVSGSTGCSFGALN